MDSKHPATDYRRWLEKAEDDLLVAHTNLEWASAKHSRAHLLLALFCCHQASEKALKSILVFSSASFRWTHSIEELGHAVLQLYPQLAIVISSAVHLTQYAWRFRYPGELDEPDSLEADEALEAASNLLSAIRGILAQAEGTDAI